MIEIWRRKVKIEIAITPWYSVTQSPFNTHDEHRKVVHRPCSSHISSVQNSCHDLAKWLSHYLYFFSFSFSLDLLYIRSTAKYHITSATQSHEKCGKIVHKPCSSCISSVQEINKNSIKFSLSTQTWRVIKSSRLSYYNSTGTPSCQLRFGVGLSCKGTPHT